MHSKLLSGVLLGVLFCCFCGGSQMVRKSPEEIDKFLLAHPDLPAVDKSCIVNGRTEFGIQQGTLLFLLGEPNRKETVTQPWGAQEKWIYRINGVKTFTIEDKHVVGVLESDK